jgi:predicted ArsR family transcriptional regulator
MDGSRDGRNQVLEGRRGRILGLLRRAPRTVAELAAALELTDNAVRQHLGVLERDGLVAQRGRRSEWTGRPAHVYELTAQGEALYPKPYARVLGVLLGLLEERGGAAEVEELLREVGRRLSPETFSAEGDLRGHAERAAEVLTGLGGLAEVRPEGASLLIQGYSCPLGDVARDHPLTCRLAEALVGELVGTAVRERCERGERPRCAFEIVST